MPRYRLLICLLYHGRSVSLFISASQRKVSARDRMNTFKKLGIKVPDLVRSPSRSFSLHPLLKLCPADTLFLIHFHSRLRTGSTSNRRGRLGASRGMGRRGGVEGQGLEDRAAHVRQADRSAGWRPGTIRREELVQFSQILCPPACVVAYVVMIRSGDHTLSSSRRPRGDLVRSASERSRLLEIGE